MAEEPIMIKNFDLDIVNNSNYMDRVGYILGGNRASNFTIGRAWNQRPIENYGRARLLPELYDIRSKY